MELSTSTRADVSVWLAPRAKLDGLSLLDHLFNRLDGMYPGKWKANFPSETSIKNWQEECCRVFDEDGITLAHISAGLRTCRRMYRDWPPSVPQLADACMPPVDPVATYHEAVAGLEARGKGELGEWSHPAVYWAASKLARDLMGQSFGQMRDRWAGALRAQLAKGAWDAIPEPRLQLAAPGKSATSPAAAAAILLQLGASEIIKRADGKFDHLTWAKRVVAKADAGERVPTSVLRDARAALGVV